MGAKKRAKKKDQKKLEQGKAKEQKRIEAQAKKDADKRRKMTRKPRN